MFWLTCVTVNIQSSGSNAGRDFCATDQCRPSSIMLCSTPTHTSIRCRFKSFTSCAFMVDSLLQIL